MHNWVALSTFVFTYITLPFSDLFSITNGLFPKGMRTIYFRLIIYSLYFWSILSTPFNMPMSDSNLFRSSSVPMVMNKAIENANTFGP